MTPPTDATSGSRWSATDAAGYIFERLAGGSSGGLGGWSGAGDTDGEPAGPSVEGTRVRASIARSIDTYSDLLKIVFTSLASEVGQALTVPPAGADQPTPVTLIGRPGSVAGAVVWIHNTSTGLVPEFTLRMTDLWRADGSSLGSDLGSTDPVKFTESMEPRRSAWVSLRVPVETRPGYYYGHLIAQGLPDVAVPLRLVVR